MSLLVGGLLIGQRVGLPSWFLVLFGVAISILLVNFLAMNWYFAIRNPDALRSERFILTKLAMRQKNFRGDNLVGFVKALSDDGGPTPPNENPTTPTVLIDEQSPQSRRSGDHGP